MTEETVTAAEVKTAAEAKIKAIKADIPGLERALASATDAMKSVAAKGVVADIVAASGAITAANKALDGAKADVEVQGRKLQGIADLAAYEVDLAEYDASVKPIHSLVNPIQSALFAAVQKNRELFEAAGVERVSIVIDHIEGEMLAEHDVYGPSKPKPPKSVRSGKSGGGGGNGGRFVNVSPDGKMRLTDRDFVALVGPANIGDEKTAHATNPETKGGTLYVTARSLRDKLGWTREQK